ncbi:hypothetical protein E5288_WYG000882 [Bos mutus]|uniref:Uncharacterized protein n=1 Tax=Bos mutus TaxID=72004 RepID=A0A6B0RNG9_9CETA|nr:hypothetical protein [Bos mutus]
MLGCWLAAFPPRLIPEERSLLPQAASSGARTHLHRAVAGTGKAVKTEPRFFSKDVTSKISSSNLPRGEKPYCQSRETCMTKLQKKFSSKK